MGRYRITAWGPVDTRADDIAQIVDGLNVQGETPRLGGGACDYRLPPRPTAGGNAGGRQQARPHGTTPPTVGSGAG